MSVALLFIFPLCFILIKILIYLSSRYGFVDIPNDRSCHTYVIPSSAGIPIFISVFFAITLFSPNLYESYSLSLFGIGLVFLLGVFDDLKDIRARYKIIIIALATTLVIADGLVITDIGTYFGHTISLKWLAISMTIFSVIVLTNAFNLIDGIDGLAGIIAIIILGSLLFIGYQNNDLLLMSLSPLVISSLLAFLLFNWSPAIVFMGDSGSLTLGFVISILCIRVLSYISPVVVLYLIAIPVIDTSVVICRRIKNKKSIFSPDKNHLHHVLLELNNGNMRKTVIIIVLIQFFYSSLGLVFSRIPPQEALLFFFLLNIVLWYFVLTMLSRNQKCSAVALENRMTKKHST